MSHVNDARGYWTYRGLGCNAAGAASGQQASDISAAAAKLYPQGQEDPIPALWTASYAASGLLIRDVTGKKLREIAAIELSKQLGHGLRDKIKANMKAHPGGCNVDAVRYEVQFLIHTREEFEQAVRAEAKRLLEKALS